VQSLDKPINVLRLAFPDHQYNPSVFPERNYIAPISGNISLPLGTPEIRTCLWHDSPVFAPVHVPKTSVHEDHFSRAREDNVRLSCKVGTMKAVPEAHLVKQGADDALGLRIATTNTGHAHTSLCGRKNIRHERTLSYHQRVE
jgi:hypothetical protein